MKTRMTIGTLVAVVTTVLATACATAPAQQGMQQGMSMDSEAAALWSRMCSHCHNLRPAPEFTAEQWSVIVSHMRTQAHLTRSEAEAIAEYLERMTGRGGSA